jgi:hypothetical protein
MNKNTLVYPIPTSFSDVEDLAPLLLHELNTQADAVLASI